jgi:hypothetical protein
MSSDWPEFPEITKEHLLNARLYANRDDMIGALPVRRRGLVAEIGVWRAAFSKVLAHPIRDTGDQGALIGVCRGRAKSPVASISPLNLISWVGVGGFRDG